MSGKSDVSDPVPIFAFQKIYYKRENYILIYTEESKFSWNQYMEMSACEVLAQPTEPRKTEGNA